jgi:hypothetical protein
VIRTNYLNDPTANHKWTIPLYFMIELKLRGGFRQREAAKQGRISVRIDIASNLYYLPKM